jgi:hypothetical protein
MLPHGVWREEREVEDGEELIEEDKDGGELDGEDEGGGGLTGRRRTQRSTRHDAFVEHETLLIIYVSSLLIERHIHT